MAWIETEFNSFINLDNITHINTRKEDTGYFALVAYTSEGRSVICINLDEEILIVLARKILKKYYVLDVISEEE